VEPRPGTKGDADQQSAHRTQSRGRVTQALDRVRKAARQRKKEQFTTLLHHINGDTLRTAFYALSERGQPPFDLAMMTALLLYGYCNGVYSSRRIAKAPIACESNCPNRCSDRSSKRVASASSCCATSRRSPPSGASSVSPTIS